MNSFALNHVARLPAEFSNHTGTIAIFPFRKDIWHNDAKPAQNLLVSAINIISKHERVILCTKKSLDKKIINMLNTNIDIANIDYDDIWAREALMRAHIIPGIKMPILVKLFVAVLIES
ncbi:MAG: agmatine deiminase family protein [Ruminococcus flavefaciens]|nr:agmatine deiminase family protein [Ruminococcus flavefaciens]